MHDAEDACQQICFWMPEVMVAYDLEHARIRCRFRTFLRRAVRWRSSDFFDHIQRQHNKHDPAVDLNQLVDARPNGAELAALAEKQQLLAQVVQVRHQLTDRSRWICDQVAAGKSIADMAQEMGVTFKMARHARDLAFAEFKALWLRGSDADMRTAFERRKADGISCP